MNEPEGGKKPVFSTQSLTSHEKKENKEKKEGRNNTIHRFLHMK